jgi:hypothetical protein
MEGYMERREEETGGHSIDILMEQDTEEEGDLQETEIQDNKINWNDETERLLQSWADDAKCQAYSHGQKRKICKYLNMILLLTTMTASYIFGSSGMIRNRENEEDNETQEFSLIQSYVLLVVGAITTLMKVCAFEKRAEKHKKMFKAHSSFYKKIEMQLALPKSSRKSFIPFVSKIQREHQTLMKTSYQ